MRSPTVLLANRRLQPTALARIICLMNGGGGARRHG